MSKLINVALLGVGTVGGGVYGILEENQAKISANIKKSTGKDVQIKVKKILDKDDSRKAEFADGVLTTNFDEIANDEDIKIIVELIGGDTVAPKYIKESIAKGKNVVTANKLAIAKAKGEFENLAKEYNVEFCYEASVGGTIPVIRVIKESLEANNIIEISGIVNGTTNFILSAMTKEGKSYSDVLKVAQELGFAEADPTSDVEGYDPAYKMSILGSLAFDKYPKDENISTKGITELTLDDIEKAKADNKVIKLIGKTYLKGDDVIVEVAPTLVDKEEALANVNGAENAISIKCDNAGVVVLQGQGAGSRPTASAVVSDIINITKKLI